MDTALMVDFPKKEADVATLRLQARKSNREIVAFPDASLACGK